jgi:hypothetical protein
VWEEEIVPNDDDCRRLELVPEPMVSFRTGLPISRRRAARERMMRRRRRAIVALGVTFSLVILAWPGHAFGGVTGLGTPADEGTAVLTSGMVYVVQPGDSVMTIARLIDSSDPGLAARALRHELGSSVVVPGEHVLIP